MFNRRAQKPSTGVTGEGYFRRTNGSRRSSSRRRGKRSSQRNRKAQPARSNSPVWFVPPERRRSRRQRRVWREIRYLPESEPPVIERIDDWSSNLSDDQFDDLKLLLSGDFNDRREEATFNSLVSSSLGSFSATSSSSSACRPPKISDFNEDKLFSEELRTSGLLARRTTWRPATSNYFASNQFLSFLSKGSGNVVDKEKSRNESAYYRCLSSTDSETEDEPSRLGADRRRNSHAAAAHRQQHLKRQRSGLRRRPLRRKSQLRKPSGQPVFLVRKCSSLRKRPSKPRQILLPY